MTFTFPLRTSCAALALCLLATAAHAQSVRDVARDLVQANDLGRALQTLSIFGGAPGISAADYYGQMDLSSYKLPLTHTFEPFGQGAFAGVAPYAELTVGYLGASEGVSLDANPRTPNHANIDYDSWSGLGGAGLEFTLGDSFKLRPMLLAGYSHISGGADFRGPGQAALRDATRGILVDSSIDSVLVGGAVELAYDRKLEGDVRLKVRLRYNEIGDLATGASDPSLKASGAFGVATGGMEFNGPTEWQVASHPLRWIAFANATWLDTPGDLFGFNSFAELGGGLQFVDPDVIAGIESVSLRTSAIVGDGVTGWSLGVSLGF